MAQQITDENIKTEIAVLRRDVDQLEGLMTRLDTAIEKMTEVSNGINKILAVHDSKLNMQHNHLTELYNTLDSRRKEAENSTKEIYEKLAEMKDDIKKDQVERHNEILSELRNSKKDTQDDLNAIRDRIKTLEKWKWLTVGGAGVASWIISKIDISALL